MSSSLRHRAAGTLRAEMARQRHSSVDLAGVLGVSQSSASRRMTSETCLDLDEVEAVAAWLKIPVTTFLGTEVPAEPSALANA